MKKLKLIFLIPIFFSLKSNSQAPKIVYVQLGGPGLVSANYDMRFSQKEDGIGGRIGVGGFSLGDYYDGGRVSIFTIPAGLNYLLGKDGKNYFEVGAGFTYVGGNSRGGDYESDNFSSSFGNLTFGYRLAPAKGGFMFKAEITPVFGRGFFMPYYGGVGFGYKF